MAESLPRISVRTILVEENLQRTAGDKGLTDENIAKGLAPGAGISQGVFLGVIVGGKALGQSLGIANRKQVTRLMAQPYGTVLRAMVVAMSGGSSGLTTATDTRTGAYLEGTMPSDMLSVAGRVSFDVIDRGDLGAEVIGASEVKGQMFSWGKGERTLVDILDKAEQLARRY